jgi:hypothetical protein
MNIRYPIYEGVYRILTIKAFDLKKRMLYDIKEFGEDNEGE